MNDLLFIETGNGGDLVLENEDLKTTNNFSNQIYFALFGGNLNSENGEQFEEYWANSFFADENKFVSSFEKTLMDVVLNSSGLQKLTEAANSDLSFLKKYANYTIDLSILDKDSLYLYIVIKAPNNIEEKNRIIWNNELKTITSWQS